MKKVIKNLKKLPKNALTKLLIRKKSETWTKVRVMNMNINTTMGTSIWTKLRKIKTFFVKTGRKLKRI